MSKDTISILVADNNPPVFKNIKATLRDYDGLNHNIEFVHSSKDTIEKASGNKYDLILINQKLRDKSGIAILQTIQKKKLGVPVIMIVAKGEEKLGVKAMEKGACDYLTKQEVNTVALNRAIRRVMQRRKLENDIRDSLKKLETLAIKDGLTGLYNQRHFREVLKNEYKKSKRNLQPLSCIMLDLDYFKSVNDNHGHQFGDFVLVHSAQILWLLVRDTDLVARYGGEEFFIILPNTNLNGAFILAERIRAAFAEHVFEKGDASNIVTVSIGVSASTDNNVVSAEELIANADKSLYDAKHKGRNLVCAYDENLASSLIINEETKKINNFNSRLEDINKSIKSNCIESTHGILREIEKGWDYINEHSVRVSGYAEKLMREMLLPEEDIHTVKRAALLHDIGMVGVNSRILKKKGKLTRKEYDVVKKHSNIGVKLMEKTRLFEKELPIILYHHERFDGNGYPHRLKGDTIPVGARILAVAEAYDVMKSKVSYKKSISNTAAVTELKNCSGTQFDPDVVDAFVRVIEKT